MKNKKLGFIITTSVIIMLIAIGIYKKPWIVAHYAEIKYNTYKKGDNMYFSESHLNELSKYKVHLYRYIKDNSSDDVLMFPTNEFINKNIEMVYKKKTIGTYVKTEFLYPSSGSINIILRLYAIKLNNTILLIDRTNDNKIPTGYSCIDSNLYVVADYFDKSN